jgi:hypothetical protein
MTARAGSGDAAAWRAWRPMRFGGRPARRIPDPVVEPFWPGRRVLVHLAAASPEAASIEIVDEDGLELAGHPAIRAAIGGAALAAEVVLDGYLVEVPRRDATGIFGGQPAVSAPGLTAAARQLVLGGWGTRPDGRSGGRRAMERGTLADPLAAGAGDALRASTVAAFVAVDLLAIDGEAVLDVPLLERKRLLDSALTVGELVRRGPHVRPPVEAWYGQWRAFGFAAIAVKSANSRYDPGVASDDWAIARLPRG